MFARLTLPMRAHCPGRQRLASALSIGASTQTVRHVCHHAPNAFRAFSLSPSRLHTSCALPATSHYATIPPRLSSPAAPRRSFAAPASDDEAEVPEPTRRYVPIGMDILGPSVMIVSATGVEGTELKIHAVAAGEEDGLHLVQVGVTKKGPDGAELDQPLPVCRFMNDTELDLFTAPRKQSEDEEDGPKLKEVRFGHNIAEGDVQTKVRQVMSFLEKGLTIRITIKFQRQWQYDQELAELLMDNILDRIEEFCTVVRRPTPDERGVYFCEIEPSPAVMKELEEREAKKEAQRKKKEDRERKKLQREAERARLREEGLLEEYESADRGYRL